MALTAVLFEMRVILALATAAFIVSIFLYAKNAARKLSFRLGEQFEVANKLIRICIVLCTGVYLVLGALAAIGVSASPRTSVLFGGLGVLLMIGSLRIYNELSQAYLHEESVEPDSR